jgi:hypothetical protein
MSLLDWLPSITTSGLLAAALWLGRHLILTRLTNSVKYEFDQKIEALRAQLREGEERLKADLRAKEIEIAALRSGAMTALASRQIAVDKRRLEAVDQLWSAVTSLASARGISAKMSLVKYEEAAKLAEHNPQVRKFFEVIGTGFDLKNLNLEGASKARPFVSPMAWATYSAIQAITMHAVIRLHLLQGGLGTKDFINNDAINKLVKTVLPHQAGYIDKYGPAGYHYLLEELDVKIINELQAMLAGVEADKASIEQAAEIVKQSNEVVKQISSGQINA